MRLFTKIKVARKIQQMNMKPNCVIANKLGLSKQSIDQDSIIHKKSLWTVELEVSCIFLLFLALGIEFWTERRDNYIIFLLRKIIEILFAILSFTFWLINFK